MPRARYLLASLLGAVLIAALPAPAMGADPSDVGWSGTGELMGGINVNGARNGSFYEATSVTDGTLRTEMTLQLPPAWQQGEPGPVAILWQFAGNVFDATYGDSAQRLLGEPQVMVLLPNCDAAGNCAIRFALSGPIAPVLQDADLDWVGDAYLDLRVEVIRTFSSDRFGERWQRVSIGHGERSTGTLAAPADTWGQPWMSKLFAPEDAMTPVELPGQEYVGDGPLMLDWVALVRQALDAFTPPDSPDPVPIDAPSPTPVAARVPVVVDVTFTDACPSGSRFVLHDATGDVALSRDVEGSRGVRAELALPRRVDWTASLYDSTGEVLTELLLHIGSADVHGTRVTGHVSCSRRKGALEEEALSPTPMPNPSVPSAGPTAVSAPVPARAVAVMDWSVAMAILAGGLLLAGGGLVLALRLRRR